MSNDARLAPELRLPLNQNSLLLVESSAIEATSQLAKVLKPVAILLDLDLPGEAAWAIADALLADEACPPILLLADHIERFDVSSAIPTGSLLDKSGDPALVVSTFLETLSRSNTGQRDRNAIQRLLIRWLKPCSWSIRVTSTHRFGGINK